MSFLALAASALILGQGGAASMEVANPIVQVGVFAYEPGGGVTARAVGTTPRLESVAWVSATACQLGAGRMPAEGTAAHAWRFSGKVLDSTAEEAVIQLDWQRTVDRGQVVPGSGSSVQLTLRVGEPVQLDFIAPTTTRCAATVAFEARYEPRGFQTHLNLRGGGTGSGSGAGTGAGSPAGAGGGGGAALGKQYGARGDAPASTAGSTATARAGSPPASRESRPREMNVWLVHTAPGRDERVQQALVVFGPQGAKFMFPRVLVDTPEGQMSVQIGGEFTSGDNGRELVFSPIRTVMFKPAAGRATGIHRRGEGKVSSPMPGPDEVLSFELPPVWTGTGPGIPDKFAVRVQFTRL